MLQPPRPCLLLTSLYFLALLRSPYCWDYTCWSLDMIGHGRGSSFSFSHWGRWLPFSVHEKKSLKTIHQWRLKEQFDILGNKTVGSPAKSSMITLTLRPLKGEDLIGNSRQLSFLSIKTGNKRSYPSWLRPKMRKLAHQHHYTSPVKQHEARTRSHLCIH